MRPNPAITIVAAAVLVSPALAQDLYDTTVLRTINLQFHDANYWTLLQQNYQSQTNILADLTINGVTYPDVGVRFRGNTSYTALPSGSQKCSFNLDINFVHADQAVMGYSSMNLNNGFHDPTFCREVVYNNFVAQFIPNMRANHVVLTLNGENWGVYINVQQFDKDMLRDYFADEDGLRIKCANNPSGPGLRYNGATSSGYTGYEIKDAGGLADPWAPLIDVCNKVTNEPVSTWQNIDAVFAVDPSIWSTVFENLLTDDDSYVNKGADFSLYRDPYDNRMYLLQTDANETFTQTTWSPTLNFTSSTKPVLSHVLAAPELRQRFMAHYRAMVPRINWTDLGAEFTRLRNLIDAAVQADPKKLYSYTLFQNNFTSTVSLPYSGPAGGTVPGLQQFVTGRASYLAGIAELAANGPTISSVTISDEFPDPTDQLWVKAAVAPNGSSVAKVELWWRGGPGIYQRVTMLDNGLSNDGAAGDGVYGGRIPVTAHAGQAVSYYVAATANNSYSSLTFFPELSECDPLQVSYAFGQSGIRITEYMYQGTSGEFLEITNLGTDPVDLTGWSLDDDSSTPGTFSLSGAGVLASGASVVVTDGTPATFRSAWNIPSVVVLGPNTVAALGRNDQINLFDASGNLVDRLSYGDESFPGTIRTQQKSGQLCHEAIGQNDIFRWTLAAAGDVYGSYAATSGELGNPGVYVAHYCDALPCPGDLDGSGAVDGTDLGILLGAWGSAGTPDLDGDGTIDGTDLGLLLGSWGACP